MVTQYLDPALKQMQQQKKNCFRAAYQLAKNNGTPSSCWWLVAITL